MLLIVVLLGLVLFCAGWADCTKGEVNCTYPGLCSQYIDTNNDGICDHSQPDPATTTTLSNTVTTESAIPGVTTTTQVIVAQPVKKTLDNRYGVKYIAGVLFALYLVSFLLKKRVRRRLWNTVLAVFFVVSAVSGLLLAIGINIYVYPSMLYWHVETGIVMTVIGILHMLWHSKYYWRIISRKK